MYFSKYYKRYFGTPKGLLCSTSKEILDILIQANITLTPKPQFNTGIYGVQSHKNLLIFMRAINRKS